MKKTTEEVINGATYIVETYKSGAVVKYPKPVTIEPSEPLPPEPTESEIIMEALATLYENQKATQEAVAQLYERGTV